MPLGRHKSVFPVVSSLLLALAVISLGLNKLRTLIPPPRGSDLQSGEEDYLQVGNSQTIDWQLLGTGVFAEARRVDKPIFMVVGDLCSRAGRIADAKAFRDSDIVDLLSQQFLCVRVDISQQPAWASAYLPISRAVLGFDPMFQVWVLDPAGRIIHQGLLGGPNPKPDQFWMRDLIRRALESFRRERLSEAAAEPLAAGQANEREVLLNGPIAAPDFATHLTWIENATDPVNGGIPVNSRQAMRPFAWQFLARQGKIALVQNSLEPALRSPIVDWLDGGFFHQTNSPEWQGVEFDKLAQTNAETMSLLALVYRATGDPLYRELANRTFDALFSGFRSGRYVQAYRIGDEDEMRRSARSSFSPRVLRDHFTSSEREWLRRHFGLRVETNPQMVVRVAERDLWSRQAQLANRYLERLRAIRSSVEPQFGGDRQLDVAGSVAARMMETARLLGDPKRTEQGVMLADQLSAMRVGANDVVHSLRSSGRVYRGLRDYLAYADAMLQQHLCLGRPLALKEGYDVLQRGIYLFSEGAPGGLVDSKWEDAGPKPVDAPTTGLTDDLGESTVAQAVRLCNTYGMLNLVMQLEDQPIGPTRNLKQEATDIVQRFAYAANQMQNRVSAYYCAALETERDLMVVVSGKNAVDDANNLARKLPGTVVAPAVGPLRELLAERTPGIYLLRTGSLSGPVSQEECVRLSVSQSSP